MGVSDEVHGAAVEAALGPDAPLHSRYKAVYEATISAVAAADWDQGLAVLSPTLEGLVPVANAQLFRKQTHQLWVLGRMHSKLEPERAFAKLDAIYEEMKTALPRPVAESVKGYMQSRLLPFGAVQRIVEGLEGGLVLSAVDVPALLDRYRWRRNAEREHLELLLIASLRALAEFRDRAARFDLFGEIGDVEVENILARERQRALHEVKRAAAKHGGALREGMVNGFVQVVEKALAGIERERMEPILRRRIECVLSRQAAAEDNHMARLDRVLNIVATIPFLGSEAAQNAAHFEWLTSQMQANENLPMDEASRRAYELVQRDELPNGALLDASGDFYWIERIGGPKWRSREQELAAYVRFRLANGAARRIQRRVRACFPLGAAAQSGDAAESNVPGQREMWTWTATADALEAVDLNEPLIEPLDCGDAADGADAQNETSDAPVTRMSSPA